MAFISKKIVDGVVVYVKKCPFCHKEFETTSKRQKYCSKECSEKYNKRRNINKKKYSETKLIERLRARSHALAVDVYKQLVAMGVKEWKCEECGATENLEIHHIKQFNWLNNTPENLKLLCHKCHCKAHSDKEKELCEEGILLEEYYNQSMKPFYDELLKGK